MKRQSSSNTVVCSVVSATRLATIAASLVTFVGACGGRPSSDLLDSWAGTMEERDGAVWVTNPPEPLWPDDGQPRLELELEQVFGVDEAPEEAMLAAIRDIAVDDAGRVYILDHSDDRLAAFAPSGELLWSDGRPGQGPGELQRSLAVVWNGADLLYVANQSGTRIDTWSTAGRYLDTLLLADFGIPKIWDFGFTAPSTAIVLSRAGARVEARVLSVGQDWELTGSFTIAASRHFEQPGRMTLGVDSRVIVGALVFGSLFDHEFRTFRTDGRPDRVVQRSQTDFASAVIDLEQQTVGLFGEYVRAPVRLEGGLWLVQADWPTNMDDPIGFLRRSFAGETTPVEKRHMLDLFDAEGRWLTGRVWDHPDRPPFGAIEMIGPDGKIYTSMHDPFPQVRRYRLVVRAPG